MNYYRDIVTQKSWRLLEKFTKTYRFVLIGGWAVWLYTKQLKSKDIDLVVTFDQLEKIRQDYSLFKNDRLKKYEIIQEEIHVDIYVPQYSALGIPVETLVKTAHPLGGFRVPPPEVLLILKLVAYISRAASVKGRKDLADIVSLLTLPQFDWNTYRQFATTGMTDRLKILITSQTDLPELQLNRHQFSRIKRSLLTKLVRT